MEIKHTAVILDFFRALCCTGARAAEGASLVEKAQKEEEQVEIEGRKIWSINEKIQGTSPDFIDWEIDCTASPTASNLVTTLAATRSIYLWHLEI